MRRGEIIIGAVLILLSIGIWIESAPFSTGTGIFKTLSPAYYPRILGVLTGILGFLLMVISLMRPKEESKAVSWGNWPRVLLGVGLMFFQAFTFDMFGYFPSAFIVMTLMISMLKVKLWKSGLITCGFLVFIYLFFVQLIRLQLPMEFFPILFSGP